MHGCYNSRLNIEITYFGYLSKSKLYKCKNLFTFSVIRECRIPHCRYHYLNMPVQCYSKMLINWKNVILHNLLSINTLVMLASQK